LPASGPTHRLFADHRRTAAGVPCGVNASRLLTSDAPSHYGVASSRLANAWRSVGAVPSPQSSGKLHVLAGVPSPHSLTESALFRPVDHQRDSDSDQTTAYSTQLSSGLAEAWPEKRSRAAMRRCCRTSEWVNGQPRLSCPTRRRGVLASIDRRIQMELARLDLAVPKEERKSDHLHRDRTQAHRPKHHE